jgi:hypothetical protein
MHGIFQEEHYGHMRERSWFETEQQTAQIRGMTNLNVNKNLLFPHFKTEDPTSEDY